MLRVFSLLCFATVFAGTAQAAIIVSFSGTGLPAAPLTLGLSQTTSIDLFMVWDGTGTNFLDASDGLLSAGLNVHYNTPGGPVSVVSGSPAAGWDPFLSEITVDNTNGMTAISTTVAFLDPPVTGLTAVQIATLQIQGSALGSSTLTLSDLLPDPSVDTLTALGEYLDDPSALAPDTLDFSQSLDITVTAFTAVPEPSCIAMLVAIAGPGVWLRKKITRRRHAFVST
ncbi:MAG: hypothetical protein JNM43_14305 [Planctomycetaceae bacterium]|nr:hypothetical protein [Planctomycetaceae bacterium]